jgi:hypothetical protein
LAYIGQQPVVGRYIKIDQISGGFNGTASGFTLAAGGQGVLPGTARNLMLSLGGVIQEPETDFTVSGSGLTFTTPPVSGTTFFAVVFGDMQAVGTPSDNTVTPATISPTGTFVFPNVTVSGTTVIASGTAAVPSLSVTGDSNTGLFSPGSDQLSITAGGTERVKLGTTEVVFNDSGNDVDFRVEGDTNANLLFIDASTDRVGLGTSSPANGRLNVSAATNQITVDTGDTATYGRLDIGHFTNGTFIGTYAGSNTASDLIRFGTGGTTRMTLDSSGRLGIGTTSPNASLVVAASGAAGFEVTPGSVSASSGTLIEHYNRSTAAYVQVRTIASVHRFDIGSTEAGRFDSSGRFLVGTSTTVGANRTLQVAGIGAEFFYNAADTDAVPLILSKSRGSLGSPTIVSSGDNTGFIRFRGYDGSGYVDTARIESVVDGTPGTNDMPGRLVFSTTADGASSPSERMRISSTGQVSVTVGATVGFRVDSSTSAESVIITGSGSNLQIRHPAAGVELFNSSGTAIRVIANTGGVSLANGATAWAAISDERLKTDLIDIEDGLNKTASLRAVTGRYIADELETRRSFLIAQDVEAVLPEAVESSNPDELGLRYTEVIPLLVAALKEAKERIETLEAKVAALEGA